MAAKKVQTSKIWESLWSGRPNWEIITWYYVREEQDDNGLHMLLKHAKCIQTQGDQIWRMLSRRNTYCSQSMVLHFVKILIRPETIH